MDARAFNRGPDPDQSGRVELHWPFEDDRVRALLGRHEGDGHAGPVVLFATQTRPEGGIERAGDFRLGGQGGQIVFATHARVIEMMREVGANDRGDPAGGNVRKFSQKGLGRMTGLEPATS